MSTAFISYSRDSLKQAQLIAKDLEALGYDTWFDQELAGGQAWWNVILEQIQNCSFFAFVVEPRSLQSQACKLEYKYALKLGKSVLPIIVSQQVSVDQLPHDLATIQNVDYVTQTESWRDLARALKKLPPATSLPHPLPEPPPPPISPLTVLRERLEAPTLSAQEQAVLLLDLRSALRESANSESVRDLLKQFGSREDLFARVSAEIDELLTRERPIPANAPVKPTTPPVADLASARRPSSSRPWLGRLTQGASEVLSFTQVWISAMAGLLIAGMIERSYGNTSLSWITRKPSWALTGSLLLLVTVAWRQSAKAFPNEPGPGVIFILIPLIVGFVIPIGFGGNFGPNFNWESSIAGAVLALFLSVALSDLDSVGCFSVVGGLIALAVICLFGGRNHVALILMWTCVLLFVTLFVAFIFGGWLRHRRAQ